MASPSLQETTGLSISLFKPEIDTSVPSYNPTGELLSDTISEVATSYTHTITALGGYDVASININYNLVRAEDWIDRVGYHIVILNPALDTIWEGFINKITIAAGPIAVTRGPLVDIGNRVRVVYSTVDSSISPPIVGARARTADTEATLSQDRYGIIEKAVSVGGVSPANAVILRDSWISENSLPETGQVFNSGSQTTPNVTLELLGYFHWLKLFLYNDTTFGVREISDILKDIFAEENANVNGLYSTDMTGIITPASTIDIKRYMNKDLTAIARVKFCISYGDGTFARYLFGIYDDRKPFYDAAPSDVEYHQSITDNKNTVVTKYGFEISPWDVRPGKYIEIDDFLVGAQVPDDFRQDPRVGFIESVKYTSPYGLSWNGNKVSTVRQKLARMGLAGAGV